MCDVEVWAIQVPLFRSQAVEVEECGKALDLEDCKPILSAVLSLTNCAL